MKYSGCGGGRSSRIDIFMSHTVILTLIWLKGVGRPAGGTGTGFNVSYPLFSLRYVLVNPCTGLTGQMKGTENAASRAFLFNTLNAYCLV